MTETPKPAKRRRWRRWGINLALLLLSLVVTVLLAEIALRWAGFVPYNPPRYMEYDDVLGWHKRPLAVAEHRTREYHVMEKINAHGGRGPCYGYDKSPGVTRVLVLGDSFPEGFSVDEASLFSHRLEQALNASGPGRYEVINTGTCGYSTDQEVLLYEGSGRRYAPDIVILMFCYNDIWANSQPIQLLHSIPKPYFELSEGRLLQRNSPVPRAAVKPYEDAPRLRREDGSRPGWAGIVAYTK